MIQIDGHQEVANPSCDDQIVDDLQTDASQLCYDALFLSRPVDLCALDDSLCTPVHEPWGAHEILSLLQFEA